MIDHDEVPEMDRAVCKICDGAGWDRALNGEQEQCWACLGTGHELTRDELSESDDDAA